MTELVYAVIFPERKGFNTKLFSSKEDAVRWAEWYIRFIDGSEFYRINLFKRELM